MPERPARNPLLVGVEWLLAESPPLAGAGALVLAAAEAAAYGAPTAVVLPLGLFSAWPFGVVVRESVHSIRCWHIQQRRMHAEFLRSTSDQQKPTYASSERVYVQPAELDALPPMVIEGESVPAAAEREP